MGKKKCNKKSEIKTNNKKDKVIMKKEDILLTDDSYIKILIKENGLSKIDKKDLEKIIYMRKANLEKETKKMNKKELINKIKSMF